MWQQLQPPDVEGEGDNGKVGVEREGGEVRLHLAMRTDIYSINTFGYHISEGRDMRFIVVSLEKCRYGCLLRQYGVTLLLV